jgi:hypothetical protein
VVQQLERLNPTPKPLESPYLNGQWRLVSEHYSFGGSDNSSDNSSSGGGGSNSSNAASTSKASGGW